MAYSTLITGPERRRRRSEEQKLDLLAEAFGPGGKVTETARRADIHTSLLWTYSASRGRSGSRGDRREERLRIEPHADLAATGAPQFHIADSRPARSDSAP